MVFKHKMRNVRDVQIKTEIPFFTHYWQRLDILYNVLIHEGEKQALNMCCVCERQIVIASLFLIFNFKLTSYSDSTKNSIYPSR